MKPILERYKEQNILINVYDPVETTTMTLFIVADDYFGVVDSGRGFRAYFPYSAVLGVYENLGRMLMINLNHFVLYQGSSGIMVGF